MTLVVGMTNLKLRCSILAMTALPLAAFAQQVQSPSASKDAPDKSITEHIRLSDHHKIVATEEILELLLPEEPSESRQDASKSSRRTVYVVQVFSSAGVKAKAEATRVMSEIKSKLPGYACKLKWSQPNWRVFVGSYSTQEEAQSALSRIKRACPSVARQAHVTRDTR